MRPSETIAGLGARTDFIAQVPSADPVRLRLTPDETALFSAVGRVARISEVLERSGLDEARTIALLLSLRAKGAIAPAKVQQPAAASAVDAAMLEEVDLPPERKKEILDLERGLDRANHFDVLGLRPGASPEEAKKAYYDASRRYHPDRYYGKNLGSFRGRVDRIFKRISEAYQVLSEPEKRAAYLKANPQLASAPAQASTPTPAPRPPSPEDEARAAERRARLSRHPYLAKASRVGEMVARAKAHLEKGDAGMALTDLHVALQVDPANKEAQELLGQARKKHEAGRAKEEFTRGMEAERLSDWGQALARYRSAITIDDKHAQASFRAARMILATGGEAREARVLAQRAVELAPRVAEYHAFLATLFLEIDKKQAKKHAEEALRLEPDHPEAKKVTKKLRWPF